jgi:TATA-box binding protein (TBP) (component of TFIID and TFIIIB)
MQSKDPGQFASSLVGQQQATSSADAYISRLEKVKSDMQQSNTCSKYKVAASQGLCNDEENLKIQKIDAYIGMLKVVKEDYDALFAKAQERQSTGSQFSAGDQLTGGGKTQDGKLETIDQELEVLRARLVANMEQNSQQIEMIDKQIAFTNDLRVSVGRKQFEGDSKGLADLLKKGAVVGVLQSAANDYESDAESIKTSGGYNGKGTKY